MWFPNAPKADPEKLEWKGSHLGVTVSPDGRFLVTSMQEPMLHGWRLVDRQHMRMSGYAARVTSLGWTVGGRWLATSGSTQIILWPFQAKDGPMGKQPKLLAPSEHRVAVVACHPKQDIVAAGYADGMVLLVRVDDGAEILAKRPGDAPITALAWSTDGTLLAFGTESGEAGILDLRLSRVPVGGTAPSANRYLCRTSNLQGVTTMSMIAKGSWSALLIALAMTSAVVAQAQAPDPKGCTPQERSSQALNQGADKNAGVICPPDIDPAMKAPTPSTGDKAVIPPASGGNGTAQPK